MPDNDSPYADKDESTAGKGLEMVGKLERGNKTKQDASDDSDEQADHPRPLFKGKDRLGNKVVLGDVDLECIFELLMDDIPDEKDFKQRIANELAEAVDCRAKNIMVSSDDYTCHLARSFLRRPRVILEMLQLRSEQISDMHLEKGRSLAAY